MSDIGLFQNIGGTDSGTGGPVTIAFTSGTLKELSDQRSTDTTIPAGATYVSIETMFATDTPLTINGKPYELGRIFIAEMKLDWVNKIQDYLPEINIVANGNEFSFSVVYPSSNPLDLNTI